MPEWSAHGENTEKENVPCVVGCAVFSGHDVRCVAYALLVCRGVFFCVLSCC